MSSQKAYVDAYNLLRKTNDRQAAAAAFEEVIRNYPGTPEAKLSGEHLANLRPKPDGQGESRSKTVAFPAIPIGTLLRSNGYSEYEEIFKKNHVDLRLFCEITDEDLKEIGVASLGHRRKLLKLARLVADGGSKRETSTNETASSRLSHSSSSQVRTRARPIAKGLARFGLGMLAGHLLGEVFGGDESGDVGVGFDTDGDGVVDTVGYDMDGDGTLDSFAMDVDGDGFVDSVALDTNGDGYIDTVGVDSTGDGLIDTVAIDTDGDHNVDLLAQDIDGDGDFDRLA